MAPTSHTRSTDAPVLPSLQKFCELYAERFDARYPARLPRDTRLLRELDAQYAPEELERLMRAFFSMEKPFFKERGYTVALFSDCLSEVIVWAQDGHKPEVPKVVKGIAAWVAKQRRES